MKVKIKSMAHIFQLLKRAKHVTVNNREREKAEKKKKNKRNEPSVKVEYFY